MDDLQVANIIKEKRKEYYEYWIDSKTSQSTIGIEDGKSRYWEMDLSTPSQKGRLEKASHMRKTNKSRIWGLWPT